MILAVTVLLVSVISSRNKMTILPEGNDWNENISLSVFITAIIWCASICIQCIIMRRKFDTSVMRELLASFVFSMGVGVVLLRTEFIGFSMLAHFAERIISTMLRKISKNVDNIHGYNIFNRM
ncbi:MAG: hypothetical protein IJZ82_11805 [Lachnospiraceae bacterium]|nr:hypothetical protein [Lachnospiraceae bacterium]